MVYINCIFDVHSFYDFRDHFKATPKDRLSDESHNYQELAHLLGTFHRLPAMSDPVFQEHAITVSLYAACTLN